MSGRPWPVAASVLAVLALGTMTGCGAAGAAKPAGVTPGTPTGGRTATRCGTARTAAGVPVEIEIDHGRVSCRLALAIEREYTRALASGKVPGNGGGAPVNIRGWICQGFNTPEVLASGHASACRKEGAEILAVLPEPSPSAARP